MLEQTLEQKMQSIYRIASVVATVEPCFQFIAEGEVVKQFLGDGVLALFGAPWPMPIMPNGRFGRPWGW
jgi:hypothetical protein